MLFQFVLEKSGKTVTDITNTEEANKAFDAAKPALQSPGHKRPIGDLSIPTLMDGLRKMRKLEAAAAVSAVEVAVDEVAAVPGEVDEIG